MALTPSNMLPLATDIPDFELTDTVSGESISNESFKDFDALVVMFICNHCPYVIHVHDEILRIYDDYSDQGVDFVAISSNDIENYPQDGPEKMKELAIELGIKFPYLFDSDQSVAKSFDAACTPDFYVFNKHGKLTYRGRLDESRPGNGIGLSGTDLRNAIDLTLKGEPVSGLQYPSMGCNIKWKSV